MILEKKVIYQNGAIREFEKPEVCEAIKVANENRWTVGLTPTEWDEREARLKKKHEENTKDPDSAENHIKEDSSENPALAESASQFNDALLDEQAKKIAELTEEKERLEDKITIFNIFKNRNDKAYQRQIRSLDKENEELKKKLADKVVDKIDAQALKSAESALAYKEKVIAEKDDVIADLGKELAATKKELEEKTNLVEMVRKGSKEYREYGIAALSMIRKMAKVIVNGGPVSSKDYKEYRRLANGYSFNPQLPDFSEEEEKKLDAAKLSNITAKCMRAARESINDVFESYAAKYAKSTLDELKDKAYESFNAKAHKLGLVGSDDGKGIPDQMVRVDIDEELSKVLDDVIDQFLLFGEIIIKEEK